MVQACISHSIKKKRMLDSIRKTQEVSVSTVMHLTSHGISFLWVIVTLLNVEKTFHGWYDDCLAVKTPVECRYLRLLALIAFGMAHLIGLLSQLLLCIITLPRWWCERVAFVLLVHFIGKMLQYVMHDVSRSHPAPAPHTETPLLLECHR